MFSWNSSHLGVVSVRQEVAPSLHFDERFVLVATCLEDFRGEGKVMSTLKLIVPRSRCDLPRLYGENSA
ncbi:hypothetical protein F2Q70_00016995 [Brassica cretica]|uniref:Uncharacterized protein n=1 Tax=Brassica cretica TaxID=69181 RepID=A0A8S9HQJ4_BRACR|nr:hypothetical protein F2Q70_00016995 [Brassica cretica]